MTEKANEEMKKKQEKPKKQIEDNVVFVGKKPTMSYVLAVITQFSEGAKEVHIKARGRSISRAIDVTEVVRNRFMSDVKYNVEIGTEKITGEGGTELNVSTIDITLTK
jgi:DNA-binding protein